MASTYSTNLALELIGTGDQAGTWGNTTNTNLGTLIEQAISGYVTQAITDGADTTITIPNGSTGVARNMYIECTGTLSADRNLVVPANKKLYFIYNNTTGGFAVTVKVSGQTGVSVANGRKVILVSNGTDIVEAANSLFGITRSDSLALTALGYQAGDAITTGERNTTIGYDSGTNITTGSDNVTIGNNAGANIAGGTLNVCVGSGAGSGTTTGNTNVSIGYLAGPYGYNNGSTTCVGGYAGNNQNTGLTDQGVYIGFFAGQGAFGGTATGVGNTAVGGSAMRFIAGGGYNSGVGNYAIYNVTTGAGNSAIGFQSLSDLSTGSYNAANGYQAIAYVTTGSGNVGIGDRAGSGITTGSNNVSIGTTSYASGNYSNSTCLGNGTAVTGSNQVQLGNSSTTTYAYGAVQDRSDARDKADIQDTQLGLNFIMALRPRDYRWDMREDYKTPIPIKPRREDFGTDEDYDQAVSLWNVEFLAWQETTKLSNLSHDGTHKRTRLHHGLVAQEVKATMDSLGIDFGGYQDHSIKGGEDVLSIGYNELIGPLIKAIQELKAEFDEYKANHP